ncbi:MAG TPA: hypothetical protein VJB35_05865 [Candidatus Nanoarchaeia archaeon]|nr:hypothetical protein [Candidatus Nanoarchaeia archaeon]
MKTLVNFDEFLKRGIVVKRTPENSRASFLIKESERKYKSLMQIIDKIGINELNSHEIIEYCYDILIYLIRAKLHKKGFNSSGEGAHEAEVSYMRNLNFSENEVLFMNQLRFFRNSIKYYGKSLDEEYAHQVLVFLKKIYPKMLNLMKD